MNSWLVIDCMVKVYDLKAGNRLYVEGLWDNDRNQQYIYNYMGGSINRVPPNHPF